MSFIPSQLPVGKDPRTSVLIWCGIVSLFAFAAVEWLGPADVGVDRIAATQAVQKMQQATDVVRAAFREKGLRFDDVIDPNHTGLVGDEYTELTTTLGSLEAKRTTTNPAMAGLMVQLLKEAGVRAGDTIAVGCSGSFPAMAIAVLAASEALKVTPLMIASLGSSSYGATRTDMTLLDILKILDSAKVINHLPLAATLGGADDVGNEFEAEVRQLLIDKIKHSGVPFLFESDLQQNVARRLQIYFGSTGSRRIAAFVNIGGNYADLGTSPLILKLEPGVNRTLQIPEAKETHGVVFAMANRHIPLVHVLHIKGLAVKYGIPWDPVPLPKIEGVVHARARLGLVSPAGAVIVLYVIALIVILVRYRRAFYRTPS
jgi:poly-gamma-glutamate system protein